MTQILEMALTHIAPASQLKTWHPIVDVDQALFITAAFANVDAARAAGYNMR
jgi:hypothetical protein